MFPQILAFSFSSLLDGSTQSWAALRILLQLLLHSSVTLGLLLVTVSRFPVLVSKLLCHPSTAALHSICQGLCSGFHRTADPLLPSLAHSALSTLVLLLAL